MRFRFVHVCTCIFITTNQWHNWINEVFKLKYSNLITNCFEFAYWRVSIIFTFAAICNKLVKIKLPQEFQSIWGLNLTVQTSKLKFSNFITNCVDCVFFFFFFFFFFGGGGGGGGGDFRWFSHLPQFVINFWNLNCPRSFKVYVPVSSLQLIRGLNLTV